MTNMVEHFLVCLLVLWITSFVKNLFTSSAYLYWIVVFLKLTYWENTERSSKYKTFAR